MTAATRIQRSKKAAATWAIPLLAKGTQMASPTAVPTADQPIQRGSSRLAGEAEPTAPTVTAKPTRDIQVSRVAVDMRTVALAGASVLWFSTTPPDIARPAPTHARAKVAPATAK